MPSSAEYQDAIELASKAVDDFSSLTGDGVGEMSRRHYRRIVAHYTLALRWLRVGAAMEAGTLQLSAPVPALNDPRWWARNDKGSEYAAPDPLTAAERAMGVGT